MNRALRIELKNFIEHYGLEETKEELKNIELEKIEEELETNNA